MEKYWLFHLYSLNGRISHIIILQLCKNLPLKTKVQYLNLFFIKLHKLWSEIFAIVTVFMAADLNILRDVILPLSMLLKKTTSNCTIFGEGLKPLPCFVLDLCNEASIHRKRINLDGVDAPVWSPLLYLSVYICLGFFEKQCN